MLENIFFEYNTKNTECNVLYTRKLKKKIRFTSRDHVFFTCSIKTDKKYYHTKIYHTKMIIVRVILLIMSIFLSFYTKKKKKFKV